MEVCETIFGGIWQVLRGKIKENYIVIHAQIACEIDIRTLTSHQVFGQVLDQIFDQVLGQILDQIFYQVLDQVFWTRKDSVQFY